MDEYGHDYGGAGGVVCKKCGCILLHAESFQQCSGPEEGDVHTLLKTIVESTSQCVRMDADGYILVKCPDCGRKEKICVEWDKENGEER